MFSTGNVTDVGGLVGLNNTDSKTAGKASSITQASGTGAVIVSSGSSAVGGLVGSNTAGNTVTQSFAIGPVLATGSSNVGGLVGLSAGTVTSSFWDTETTGQATSAGGGGAMGVTTATLQSVGLGEPIRDLEHWDDGIRNR